MARIFVALAVLPFVVCPTARGEGAASTKTPGEVLATADLVPPATVETSEKPVSPPAAGANPAEHLCEPVTAGDPNVASALWQRTWGQAGIFGYATGSKMAPNGVPYDPLFAVDLTLNIAVSNDRSLYLFTDTRFWTQKASADVTNSSQGSFDFSKRQLDADAGMAWNYLGPWEGRVWAYSYNNLNRGISLATPIGYNDGFAIENRYYFDSTNFDKGLYRFVSAGYYLTKDLIGADGVPFKPSLFARASLALDLVPERLYLYSDVQIIARRSLSGKLLLADVGVAARPFTYIPDLEFRVGADNNYDMQVGKDRTLFYGNVRIVW